MKTWIINFGVLKNYTSTHCDCSLKIINANNHRQLWELQNDCLVLIKKILILVSTYDRNVYVTIAQSCQFLRNAQVKRIFQYLSDLKSYSRVPTHLKISKVLSKTTQILWVRVCCTVYYWCYSVCACCKLWSKSDLAFQHP